VKKGLAANERLVSMIRNHVLYSRAAHWMGRPVAWVTSGSPVEILLAAGIVPFYPENHAAICSARSMGEELATASEAQGYSRDLCSYFRIDLGTQITGTTPLGTLLKPDLIVTSNNICGTVQNWFRITADRFGVPCLFVDTPYSDGKQTDGDTAYVRDQLLEVAAAAGKIGRRVDERRLGEFVLRSRDTMLKWRECLHMGAERPAAFTSFDAFVHMAPIVSMRGTRRALWYYQKLLAELKARAAAGVAMVPDERARVVWDNIAIWPAHRQLKKLFRENKVALVADTYTHAWTTEHLDPTDPYTALARSYCDILLNHGVSHRVRVMKDLLDEYGADGFILHSNRSCKRWSLGQYGVKKAITDLTGKPGVVIEADMADPRSVSFEHLEQRLQPFFEVVRGGA
jgi:benzoyl-CoA reductase/2-hydroxyglutaryl-CoA dehydratase subunit BcrC/BadD/HgdB